MKICGICQKSENFFVDGIEPWTIFDPLPPRRKVTLGNVIDPTQIIKKLLLSPKLSPSDNSIIEVTLNRSYIQFIFKN